jgi:adenylate cyclase
MKTAIIERKLFGGTCVNVDCIPTKTLVASARAAYMARRGPDFSVNIGGPITVDMKQDLTSFLNDLSQHIEADGLPLLRTSVTVGTLHPQISGYYVVKWRGKDATELNGPHGLQDMTLFQQSPQRAVYEEGVSVRFALDDPNDMPDYPIAQEIADAGGTDYLAMPLEFSGGERTAISFVTVCPGGFSSAETLELYRVTSIASRLLEVTALRRTTANLLDTYVGHIAGQRVLNGEVQRGHGQTIPAVLWQCDLRQSTELSETTPRDEMIETLNDFFQCLAGAVEEAGGEILKFIGDAMLAIFPLSRRARVANAECEVALAAAEQAISNIAEPNKKRVEAGKQPLSQGIALHVGDVMFGNIGAEKRLDFTINGPAVNAVSRLERLASELKMPIVFSSEFAQHTTREVEDLGDHFLRGIEEPVKVYTLRR